MRKDGEFSLFFSAAVMRGGVAGEPVRFDPQASGAEAGQELLRVECDPSNAAALNMFSGLVKQIAAAGRAVHITSPVGAPGVFRAVAA